MFLFFQFYYRNKCIVLIIKEEKKCLFTSYDSNQLISPYSELILFSTNKGMCFSVKHSNTFTQVLI